MQWRGDGIIFAGIMRLDLPIGPWRKEAWHFPDSAPVKYLTINGRDKRTAEGRS
jgi:hypothetical protein